MNRIFVPFPIGATVSASGRQSEGTHMTNPQILSKIVDHIPVIWVEPENFTAPAHLVIWMDGLTGNKERMQPYLATLAASGFVAASFDAFQHGRSEEHTSELQSLRHLVCR